MGIKAIVYLTDTGHTLQYAKILETKLGLPTYSLAEAKKTLEKKTPIIYMAPLFANAVKKYKNANKYFDIKATCGVGLCDTGAMINEVRKATKMSLEMPLFTLQGGFDRSKLKGLNKFLINLLTKSLQGKEQKTKQEERMYFLLTHDDNYVKEENTETFVSWYKENN